MTQDERDRLVTLKKANKGLITQKQAAAELEVTERQIRRLLRNLREQGDGAVLHGLKGKASNRRHDDEVEQSAVAILSSEVYRDFGPTLASEYLAKKHDIEVNRETLRQWMKRAGLWRAKHRGMKQVHVWRARRERRGELVQWDTSTHDWLEGRGPRIYLIGMIDDATSELSAQFAYGDTTEANADLLRSYLERNGRPLAFYTDKAGLFQTAIKTKRQQQREGKAPSEMPPTQIGRMLSELGITWIAAHSPQAKGRIERSFQVDQDRLVKGMRVEGVRTLEQANDYLESEYLPWWNSNLKKRPASSEDAHRPLLKQHDLDAVLSHVVERQVDGDYTFQLLRRKYRISRQDITTGLRHATIRVEVRRNGDLAARFRERYLNSELCPVTEP